MATGNDKVAAIRAAVVKGYEVNIRMALPSDIMVISLMKDGVEEKSFMDKKYGRETKAIVGSCMIEFTEYMEAK